LHWVDATKNVSAEIRLYNKLFLVENPAAEADFLSTINPNSMSVSNTAVIRDSADGKLVFNKTVGLKDSFNKK
jgi:glutaminyl-tRNA synthetase